MLNVGRSVSSPGDVTQKESRNMSATKVIKNVRIACDDQLLEAASLEMEAGRIVAIHPEASTIPSDAEAIDGGGHLLAPGFIDLHIHGLHQYLVDEGPKPLAAIAATLPRYGVTGWLPTVAPRPTGQDSAFLKTLAEAAAVTGARVLGFHLEGPFLTLTGALPPEALGAADPDRVRALMDAAHPYPAVFSVAPDFKGIDKLIPLMRRRGAPVFMTHTKATVAETEAAIEAGARHATHFYDVFPTPPVTEPGVRPCGAVEAILADPRVSVDFILDGVHVDPVALRMALQCKGPDRVCLITDAMVGAGSAPGRHTFGRKDVIFEYPGAPARAIDERGKPGSLSGSGLTLNLAVRNAVEMARIPLPQALRMASSNPARVLGLSERKGRIAVGWDADLVLLDAQFQPLRTWVGGETVFIKDQS